MKLKKYLLLLILFIVFATASFAFLTDNHYFVSLFNATGLSSLIGDGNYTLRQTISGSVIGAKLSGDNYEISGTVGGGEDSKLENDLTKAHCYPNPFKLSLGHTKIIFSHLTSHTKVRVYNIVGKLVYEKEDNTPNGELEWDAIDNDGDSLASGLYIYIITDNENHKKNGKFAIIK